MTTAGANIMGVRHCTSSALQGGKPRELNSLPIWPNGSRKTKLCEDYWMLRYDTKWCIRGDKCWFHHSSAHMTPYSKTLTTHVERNTVIPGCPRPKENCWVLREGYPAPWPLEGVSHLNKDGFTYSPTPQKRAVGPYMQSAMGPSS